VGFSDVRRWLTRICAVDFDCTQTEPRKEMKQMNRNEKEVVITEMVAAFKEAKGVFVTDFQGLTVAQITKLRADVRKAGGQFRVVKNTLLTKASTGTDYANLHGFFVGSTAVVTSTTDPVAAAKALKTFAKDIDKLKIRGGSLGPRALSKADVETLADLPSLDALRGTIVGILQAPASKIMRILNAPGTQVARVLTAYSEKTA
jgi:large subunit ribosomal protein L10